MKVILIEDRTIQRIVGLQELRKVVTCLAPATAEELRETANGCDVIFADRVMDDRWLEARNDFIARNPQAVVIEWSAFDDDMNDEHTKLPRRDKKIVKTGRGGELVAEVERLRASQPGIKTNSRLLEAVAAFLGLAVTR